MSKAKITLLCELLTGSDVYGESDGLAGLRRYHAAKKALNGNRRGVLDLRLTAIRAALKPFVVTVTVDKVSDIRIFNPLTKLELILR